mgnify:CR=1 FL=1
MVVSSISTETLPNQKNGDIVQNFVQTKLLTISLETSRIACCRMSEERVKALKHTRPRLSLPPMGMKTTISHHQRKPTPDIRLGWQSPVVFDINTMLCELARYSTALDLQSLSQT